MSNNGPKSKFPEGACPLNLLISTCTPLAKAERNLDVHVLALPDQ